MKAQIKMGESIMILIIFFFLVIFGLVFYMKAQWNSISQQEMQDRDLRAIQVAQKVQYLPELQCTEMGNVDYSCVDLLKLDALKAVHDARGATSLAYKSMFPMTKITVKQVYPDETEWDIYGTTSDSEETFFRIPVSIHDAIRDKYGFGYVEVIVYEASAG